MTAVDAFIIALLYKVLADMNAIAGRKTYYTPVAVGFVIIAALIVVSGDEIGPIKRCQNLSENLEFLLGITPWDCAPETGEAEA